MNHERGFARHPGGLRVRTVAAALAASLGLAATLGLAFGAAPAAATSCLPIDMQLRELEPGAVVVVGTVTGKDATGVVVHVDQWFRGTEPVGELFIPGPRLGEPTIIGEWNPNPGERWFIIGIRLSPQAVESNVCRQMPVDAALVATATSILGAPQLPPFGDAGGDEDDASPVPIALAAGLVVLGALGGLGAVLLLQRRSGAQAS